jgi:G3E family GTPase
MPRVPVTVLTGFLGAGKTTLMNRILTAPQKRRYAVIVNEFGLEDIDGDLIVSADEDLVRLSNGCVCCTVRGDLVDALSNLSQAPEPFDGILIETTGLADPGPIAQTFFLNDAFADRLTLDAIVTLVDARHFASTLKASHLTADQVALADLIVLNKADLASEPDLTATEAALRRLNPTAQILRATKADVPLDQIFGRQAYELASQPDLPAPDRRHDRDHAHDHDQDALVPVLSISLTAERPVDPDLFMDWIGQVARALGPDLLRSKGILAFADEECRFVFHGVQSMLEGDRDRPWGPQERRVSRLVFIGRGLDRAWLERGFADCLT